MGNVRVPTEIPPDSLGLRNGRRGIGTETRTTTTPTEEWRRSGRGTRLSGVGTRPETRPILGRLESPTRVVRGPVRGG